MSKQQTRWIKVSISYREGEREDQWDAVTLGDTSLLQVIGDPTAAALGGGVRTLADAFASAVIELVQRSERVMPPEPVESVA